jgi:phosphoribosylanthranilate isomerase
MAATKIKICGITNLEDALQAVGAGADALGFVFYAGSPRCVEAEQVRAITDRLPPFVSKVGLFVNETRATIEQTMTMAGLNLIQLHGDESPSDCYFERWPVIKALRVRNAKSLQGLAAYKTCSLLLDAWSDEAYGGTGHSFDWQLLRDLSSERPLILAGGLKPENVAQAIATVKPYAVDVSSGVEATRGRKDHEKVKEFIKQVRKA